jgi:RNA polymerase sigma-70 factor, ECF subfamily
MRPSTRVIGRYTKATEPIASAGGARSRGIARHELAPISRLAVHPGACADAELVRDLREKRPGAGAALFDRYGSYVERILARVLGHTDADLEDVLHEVFAHCLEDIGKLSDPMRLKPWLGQVAVFTARTVIRRRRRRRWLSYLVPWEMPEAAEPPVDHAERQIADRLYRALDRLPADERIAFALRYLEEMTITEAADVAGVSPATLKRRLVRARETMRNAIQLDSDAGHFELAAEDG